MKFYKPISKKYLYLFSENADIETNGSYNLSFKWNIPQINIIESEIKVISIASVNSTANTKYIVRSDCLNFNNIYDTSFGLPILCISTGLNVDTTDKTPALRISNTTIDNIKLRISQSSLIANRDIGIGNTITFTICLEITDYAQEDRTYSYNVNDKQNIAKPNYIY